MRFRLGFGLGFAAGYYFGTKAGRQQYEKLEQWVQNAKESDLVETATEKAKAVVDLGKERARELRERRQEPMDTEPPVEVNVQGNGSGSDTPES